MKDTEPKQQTLSEPSEDALLDSDHHLALLLGTGDLLSTSLNAYIARISAELDQTSLSQQGEEFLNNLTASGLFSNRESIKRTLLSQLAFDIMFIFWRESDHVSDRAISTARLERPFRNDQKYITRNALKNFIGDELLTLDSSGKDALKRAIDRVCDALEVYGFISRSEIRPNLKPYCATKRLHIVMSSACLAVSQIYARQLQTDDGGNDD